MDLAAIDGNLTRLRETLGAMSTNLVDLETDTVRTRLDHSPLTGTTAERWAEAGATLAYLWQWFSQLNDILDKATQLRGTKARLDAGPLAQLDWLVNGPSIELSTAGVPLAERGLLGPAETTIRCSPRELVDRMRSGFDQVMAVIGVCNQRWDNFEAELLQLDDQLVEGQRLAEAVGEPDYPALVRARAQLDRLRRAVVGDPLATSDGSGAGVAASLGSVVDELRRLVDLRDNLAAGLGDARALMVELRTTTAAAADAADVARAKIVHPAVIEPGLAADNVERELERVVTMSSQGDWWAAGNLLAQWTTRCRDALAEAQRALAAHRAPLAARDELRGRLDAYRAKAYRLGLLEDPALTAQYARARAQLYTAPTDLSEAEQLVRRYQQALAGSTPREVPT